MPMLLAGRGGGSLETGRVLNSRDGEDKDRRACSLYLEAQGYRSFRFLTMRGSYDYFPRAG